MGMVLQDLRYAIRGFAKRPGFTLVILLTLALGIGANTAIFSVINAVVLRPLPFDHPDELVMIWEKNEETGTNRRLVAHPNFADWRAQARTFQDMGAFRSCVFTLTGINEPRRIGGAAVSASFFDTLRVRAALGRTFQPEEDFAGAARVVVLSDGFWRQRLNANPNVIGQTLTLDGDVFTVIGVLPSSFKYPVHISRSEVWIPTGVDEKWLRTRGAHTFRVVARLAPNVTLPQAQADLDTIAKRLELQYPDSNAGRGVNIAPLHKEAVGDVRSVLLILLGAVGLVLLIACANVTNLLLARGEGRTQELVVRAALGANRAQLIRQLLTESLLLGIVGAALGVMLAFWCRDALVTLLPQGFPRVENIGIDGRVLAFTLAIAVGTGLASGLAPALRATRPCLSASLKHGRFTTSLSTRHRLCRLMVVSEVALSLILLVGAGLLLRSLIRLTNVDLGFQPERLTTFLMSMPSSYSSGERRFEVFRQVLERVGKLPGVKSAAASTTLPLSDSAIGLGISVLGWEETAESQQFKALFDSISPGYFETLEIPLLSGRLFTEQDRREGAGVMLISQSMAQAIRRIWPDVDPIGLHLKTTVTLDKNEPEYFEIVGIVGDVRGTVTDEPEPHMYIPYQQQTWEAMFFAIRTTEDSPDLVKAVRHEVARVTTDVAADAFNTMGGYWNRSIAQQLLVTRLLAIFAGLAVTLAVIGLYGMLSYTVAQQGHEIGIRMALGAVHGDILRSVLGQGLILTGIGVGIGLATSLALTRVLASQLFEINTYDPATLIGVPFLMVTVAILTCYVPARRATKVDPLTALRCE